MPEGIRRFTLVLRLQSFSRLDAKNVTQHAKSSSSVIFYSVFSERLTREAGARGGFATYAFALWRITTTGRVDGIALKMK